MLLNRNFDISQPNLFSFEPKFQKYFLNYYFRIAKFGKLNPNKTQITGPAIVLMFLKNMYNCATKTAASLISGRMNRKY